MYFWNNCRWLLAKSLVPCFQHGTYRVLIFNIIEVFVFKRLTESLETDVIFSFNSQLPVLLHETPKNMTSSVKRRVFLYCFDFTFYFYSNYRFKRSCKVTCIPLSFTQWFTSDRSMVQYLNQGFDIVDAMCMIILLFYAISLHRFQFSSVIQQCLTLCDSMDCSTPGLPVHHQLLEFPQTHVH